jgi:hypothetical protein
MAAPTRTGTASQVDGSAGDGSTSVTVPGDCNIAVALWAHWDSNGNTTLSALTLNGVSMFPAKAQLAEGAVTDESGIGVALLVNPSTGSQTLAWTWSAGGARAQGGEIVLVYVTGGNTSDPYRDADADANVASGNVVVTINSETTDLLLALAMSLAPTSPTLDGTQFIDGASLNNDNYDVSDVTPSATSTTVNMLGEAYSAMVAISLKEPGGSAALTGTATATINEADIVAGGKTIIVTLTGDTWIPSS